jgi:peroxiredoxin
MKSASDFQLTAHDGTTWRLGEALRSSSVMLVFYRGDW